MPLKQNRDMGNQPCSDSWSVLLVAHDYVNQSVRRISQNFLQCLFMTWGDVYRRMSVVLLAQLINRTWPAETF